MHTIELFELKMVYHPGNKNDFKALWAARFEDM
jgi:hypothetical protein